MIELDALHASRDPNQTRGSFSLDHLVSNGEDRGWHREAQRLCSLGVDDEVDFRRLLHGDVSRLGALGYFIYLVSANSSLFVGIFSVCGQTTFRCPLQPLRADGWQTVA